MIVNSTSGQPHYGWDQVSISGPPTFKAILVSTKPCQSPNVFITLRNNNYNSYYILIVKKNNYLKYIIVSLWNKRDITTDSLKPLCNDGILQKNQNYLWM